MSDRIGDPREGDDRPADPGAAAGPTSGPPEVDDVDAAARLALERARQAARQRGLRTSSRPRRRGGPDPVASDDGGTPDTEHGWRPGPGIAAGVTGPGPSRRDPQPLGPIAARLAAQHGWTAPLGVAGVVGRWRDVVGDQVADHCQVETFDGHELVIRASSTSWATQVRLLLPQLERRLAEEVGEGTVTSIVVLGPGGPSWKHGLRSVRGRGPRDTYG